MCKSRCFRQNIDLSRLHIILLAFYALLFLQVLLSAAIATLPSGSPTAPARARARTDRGVVDLRTGPADRSTYVDWMCRPAGLSSLVGRRPNAGR